MWPNPYIVLVLEEQRRRAYLDTADPRQRSTALPVRAVPGHGVLLHRTVRQSLTIFGSLARSLLKGTHAFNHRDS
jgi:hypothetical protein